MYWLPLSRHVPLAVVVPAALQSACHSPPDPAAVSFAPQDATLWVVYRDWHTVY
ncbi:MAG: hypothetical protein IPG64_20990 [Haliea sp.]|nr:hypothetical protein [Haliea sp.]